VKRHEKELFEQQQVPVVCDSLVYRNGDFLRERLYDVWVDAEKFRFGRPFAVECAKSLDVSLEVQARVQILCVANVCLSLGFDIFDLWPETVHEGRDFLADTPVWYVGLDHSVGVVEILL
jgi:hypothetical protein